MIIRTVTKEISGEKDYVNITQMVVDEVKKSRIWEGLATVQTLHTTTGCQKGISIQEDEPGLINDIKRYFRELFPEGAYYEHDDFEKRTINMCSQERKNGPAHLSATFFTRTSETVIIGEGQLILGPWQSILFFDFDPKGRGARNIIIQIIGQRKRKNHRNNKPIV